MGTFLTSEQERVQAQEASTPTGIFVTVTYTDPINVRGGPSTVFYPIIGQLNPGEVVPALGISPGREWIQISYAPTGGQVGYIRRSCLFQVANFGSWSRRQRPLRLSHPRLTRLSPQLLTSSRLRRACQLLRRRRHSKFPNSMTQAPRFLKCGFRNFYCWPGFDGCNRFARVVRITEVSAR